MKISTALLDVNNPVTIDGTTIGALIATAGKRHLWEERSGTSIDTIVIHYISAVQRSPRTPFRFDLILKILCDFGVSSHYLIDRRGAVSRLVPEEKRAWHCGGSIMPAPDNRQAVNDFSIGIELVATPTSGFTVAQYRSLSRLCDTIERLHNRVFTYVGHEAIAGERAVAMGLRKDIKVDPGKLFDWEEFNRLLEEARKNKESSQESGVRSQESGVRSQESGVRRKNRGN
jgi:N-acetyl-anhydromuramyl-L-alanine amidase AmpD